jgi:hypothetical protein
VLALSSPEVKIPDVVTLISSGPFGPGMSYRPNRPLWFRLSINSATYPRAQAPWSTDPSDKTLMVDFACMCVCVCARVASQGIIASARARGLVDGGGLAVSAPHAFFSPGHARFRLVTSLAFAIAPANGNEMCRYRRHPGIFDEEFFLF